VFLRKVDILGVGVHDCTEDDAVRAIESYLEDNQAGVRQVVTVNPEFIMEARRNPTFHSLLNKAALATPDGVGIVLAARLLRTPVRGRVTGVGLVNRLGELSARRGYRLFLLGAAPGVADEAAAELARRYPGVCIAGTLPGSPDDSHFNEIRGKLEQVQPQVVFVAYGAPRQDIWVARHSHELPDSVRVAMGVGGVFDYLSGRVPLAPAFMRKAGLEWLFRLYKQPWRWKRILRVFQFGIIVLWTAALRVLGRSAPANGDK
jgi:N-acetylglucosaminyldiphosphoundecaprenol N-acetyl-beta-D-mannosaminyltransferase